jgi:hypothetical protein
MDAWNTGAVTGVYQLIQRFSQNNLDQSTQFDTILDASRLIVVLPPVTLRRQIE